MAVGSAHTVAAGVAATNHNDVLAVGAQLVFELVASVHFVLLWQEFHGKVNARQIAARHVQVARLLRAASQQHRIEVFLELLWADGFFGPVGHFGAFGQMTDHDAGFKRHAFGHQLLCAAVDV